MTMPAAIKQSACLPLPRAVAAFWLGLLLAQPCFGQAEGETAPPDEVVASAKAEEESNTEDNPPATTPEEEDNPSPVARVEPAPSPATFRPAGPPPEFRGPDVTLIAGEERTVHEYRHNGQLRMIKVVPKRGKPYYLVPRDHTRGWGDLEQADALQAEWVLWEF